MTSMRQAAKKNEEDSLFEMRVAGKRSREPEEVARFMEEHFNRGYGLLSLETVSVDVLYEVGGVEQLGTDIETVVYMNKLSPGSSWPDDGTAERKAN